LLHLFIMKRLSIKKPDHVRRQILAYLTSDDEQIQYLLRLHAILLLCQQDPPDNMEIASLYGVDRKTVTRWVNRINAEQGDITALLDVTKPGRNTKMSKKQLAIIDNVLAKSPRKAGIPQDKWTGIMLSEYLKKRYGIELKVRMCQRWIRTLGQQRQQWEALKTAATF
jgi:transposase